MRRTLLRAAQDIPQESKIEEGLKSIKNIHFSRNKWFMPAVTALVFYLYSWTLLLQSGGFTTSYSRVRFLVKTSQYWQNLEHGWTPNNPFLPPHLRMDSLSYLDHPKARLVLPPVIDKLVTNEQLYGELVDAGDSNRIDVQLGPSRIMGLTGGGGTADRILKRRLPAPVRKTNSEEAQGTKADQAQ